MAKDISTVTGIQADADYPTGYKIVDGQTYVNATLYQDMIMFFQKMYDDGSITPNGNFDNEVKGYQTLTALLAYIRKNCLPDTGTTVGLSRASSETEYEAGASDILFISPLLQKTMFGGYTRIKRIPIGAWNMYTTATFDVAHGLSAGEYDTIHILSVNIISDGVTGFKPLNMTHVSSQNTINGCVSNVDDINIKLIRTDRGYYDSSYYNASTLVSNNRGYILISYIPD